MHCATCNKVWPTLWKIRGSCCCSVPASDVQVPLRREDSRHQWFGNSRSCVSLVAPLLEGLPLFFVVRLGAARLCVQSEEKPMLSPFSQISKCTKHPHAHSHRHALCYKITHLSLSFDSFLALRSPLEDCFPGLGVAPAAAAIPAPAAAPPAPAPPLSASSPSASSCCRCCTDRTTGQKSVTDVHLFQVILLITGHWKKKSKPNVIIIIFISWLKISHFERQSKCAWSHWLYDRIELLYW